MKHVSPPASTILSKWHQIYFCYQLLMRTEPLSYKWACPNFNNKQNFGSLNFLEFKGGVDTGEGFW